jgi:hypothetical protein
MRSTTFATLGLLLLAAACGDDATTGGGGTGATGADNPGAGGSGAGDTGGTAGMGGVPSSGGMAGMGGVPSTGGMGGMPGTGGEPAGGAGGEPSVGGAPVGGAGGNGGAPPMMEDCDNNADDDGDMLVDCADPECAQSPLCGDLVINEVDYDNPGTDNAEFVEIFNRGMTTVDLSTVELAPINGNNDTEYNVVALSGTLAPGAYLVVADPGTPNIAPGATVVPWLAMNSIQNGAPDGVVLRAGSVILDSMSYEGAMMGVTEGNPTLAADDDSMTQSSLIRFPNGADTNDNATDWAKTLTLPPGAANQLLAPAEICNDGIDNNMNMQIDCAEMTCAGQSCGMNGLTCATGMCSCPGGMTEMACADGMDNDCDGLSDCADPQCAAAPNCSEICNDGIDNNMNMQIDCAEMTCAGQSCGPNGVTCSMGMCSCPGGATETLCNDGLDNDCDGMSDCMDMNCAMAMNCQMPMPMNLVINEVDYDTAVGTDNAEFVEIFNPTAQAVSLSGIALVRVNGANSMEYGRTDLSSLMSIPAGGYVVVRGSDVNVPVPMGVAAVFFGSMAGTNQIQNGAPAGDPPGSSPDGLALIHVPSNTLIDAFSYEGSVTAAMITNFSPSPVSLVEGTVLSTASVDSDTVVRSLIRNPNGTDTNNAATDWVLTTTLTPGLPNVLTP